MECDGVVTESRLSLITTQSEILNNTDKIRDDAEGRKKDDQVQMQTEDSYNLTNSKICDQSSEQTNITSNEIYLATSSVAHDTFFSEGITNPTSEEIEISKLVNITEPRNISSNDIDELAESTCIQYNWSRAPKPLCVATKEYQPTDLYENFTKGCQWSPDGTCLLVPSEDLRIRIYELPRELYSGQFSSNFIQTDFKPALTVKEGGLIYDVCWYPFMNSWEPITCCFLSTSRESPVHLWDAFTGELRATYQPYNQVDEIEASLSVQFVNSGREIWCGFKNAVRTFDTDRPGRQTSTIQFKHDFPNMIGLVSCIRENPIMPGLIALGTYSKYIGLYKDGPLCTFQTGSGVTQVEFSSCGMKLFSAVRKNNEFLCWDLRNPGTVLYFLQGRQSDTNQRIQFAITPDNKQIISGGIDGNITVWELPESIDYEDLNPKYKIKLSKDCINGTSLHKSLPIIATTSGQRQYDVKNHRDNSVRLWWA